MQWQYVVSLGVQLVAVQKTYHSYKIGLYVTISIRGTDLHLHIKCIP